MAYGKKENTGVLFKNEKKQSDKQPDYTGSVLIEGKTLRIAAWIKEGPKGKYMSLSFQEPNGQFKKEEAEDFF
jgi:hypothetical protein